MCRDPSNLSVRPSSVLSVTLSSGRPLRVISVSGKQFEVQSGSVSDTLHLLTLQKTIRMSHLPIPCLFPSLSGVIQLISRIVVASAGKFERFLHNRSFGPPLPCGCNLVYYGSNCFVFQSYELRFSGKFCLVLIRSFLGSFVIGSIPGVPLGIYQVPDFGPNSKL